MPEYFKWSNVLAFIVKETAEITDVNEMRQWFINYTMKLVITANEKIKR